MKNFSSTFYKFIFFQELFVVKVSVKNKKFSTWGISPLGLKLATQKVDFLGEQFSNYIEKLADPHLTDEHLT